MYILSKYLCFQLCSLELFYIWLLILSRYSRHRVSSLALIHEHARTNDQAKRVYDHDNLRGLAIWLAMCVRLSRDRFTHSWSTTQSRKWEGRTALQSNQNCDSDSDSSSDSSDQPQPRHVYQITILHTRLQHLPLHSINTQATNK